MNVSELRIGNLFLDGKGRLCRVDSINCNYFKAPAIKGAMTTLPNIAIQITEDWLIKLGLTKSNEIPNSQRIFYNIGTFICEVGIGTVAIYYTKSKELISFIKYVHQLQNLFFALTEKELIINN